MKPLGLLILIFTTATGAKYTGPTNQEGVDLIKEYEGFRANFYNDAVGIKTIGYGHACHASSCKTPINGKYKVPLTQQSGESLLKDDLKTYEKCVRDKVTYENLNSDQFSALASFTFNLGCTNLQSSTLLAKLNRGDVAGASEEFQKWVKAGGKVLPGLVKRRNAEKELFCSGGTCGRGSGGGSCTGVVTASSLNIRSSPNGTSKIITSLSNGATVTITDRVSGTSVSGNSNWFKVQNGYVSAYYINISSSNGASWCAK